MFHLEQGWWLGVKSCSARAIGTDAEGRKGEVDISVCLAGVQANPRCVCFYLCADWWNELWVWEIDSGWGWSPPHPSACCFFSLCPLIPHHSYLPVSRFGSSHLFPLTKVEGWSQNVCVCVCVCVWWWLGRGTHNTNKVGYLVLAVLFYLTRCLSAQVNPLHHFSVLHSQCFIVPASQIICLLWESLQPSCLIFHETSSLS